MGHVLPGNCERGGGLHWRVFLAGINGDSIGRTKVATRFGGPKWQLFLADQNGGPFGQFNLGPEGGSILASLFSGFCYRESKGLIQEKQSNRKEGKKCIYIL